MIVKGNEIYIVKTQKDAAYKVCIKSENCFKVISTDEVIAENNVYDCMCYCNFKVIRNFSGNNFKYQLADELQAQIIRSAYFDTTCSDDMKRVERDMQKFVVFMELKNVFRTDSAEFHNYMLNATSIYKGDEIQL